MKFKITIAFIFIILIGSFAAFYYTKYFFSQPQSSRSAAYPEKSGELLEFIQKNKADLYDYSGKAFDQASLNDKLSSNGVTRVFHFWAGWCDPCINEMPEVLKFVKSVQQKNKKQIAEGKPVVQIFLISLDFEQKDLAKATKIFPELNELYFVQIWDKNNLLARMSAVDKLPVTFVDRGAVKMQVYEGEADWKKILADTP